MSLVNAIPAPRMILRTMRRQGSRGAQLVRAPTDGRHLSCTDCTVIGIALGSCPRGDDRMRALRGRGGERRKCRAAPT